MVIQGIIRSVIFHNEENGYTVARFFAEDEEFTVVGHTFLPEEGKELELEGEWVYHPKYREQFQFSAYREHLPTSKEQILRYLSSGMIPYVGKKTAEKMVDLFGEETLEILRDHPERLMEIEGIGKKKSEKIAEAFEEQREVREILLFTQNYGISTSLAVKIYRKFGSASMEVIQRDPYRLAEEVRGIGFATADRIAKNMGMAEDSPGRKRGAVSYVMQKALASGHCYLPFEELKTRTSKLLQLNSEDFLPDPMELALWDKFFVTKNSKGYVVYFTGVYRWENFVAQNLRERLQRKKESGDAKGRIEEITEELSLSLAEKQREALECALTHPVMILTGGPGTGKTTTLRALILLLESMGKKVVLAAPTGRAAKRMEETSNRPASTIHRLLESQYNEEDIFFGPQYEEDIDADVLILDEVSMLDLPLMVRVLQALPEKGDLILVGDKDQLPSVGPGNILGDLIGSGLVPVVELSEIFRQGKNSKIVLNAHSINHGEMPEVNTPGGDFYFIRKNPRETPLEIVTLVRDRLPGFCNVDSGEDIQVLCPMRGGPCGVEQLNILLQEAMNPRSPEKREATINGILFREGDKVMQIKNNYRLSWTTESEIYETGGEGIFNGDMGRITSLDPEEKTAIITYDDIKQVEYTFQGMEEVRLCYATTIHKSQGSEYPVVIVPIQWAPPMLLTRNLLYTAITRAREYVVLVGEDRYLKQMVDNNEVGVRYTGLKDRLLAGGKI